MKHPGCCKSGIKDSADINHYVLLTHIIMLTMFTAYISAVLLTVLLLHHTVLLLNHTIVLTSVPYLLMYNGLYVFDREKRGKKLYHAYNTNHAFLIAENPEVDK